MSLLEVNLPVALCDADHVHHRAAAQWFRAHRAGGWATCPLTENGLAGHGSPRVPGRARIAGRGPAPAPAPALGPGAPVLGGRHFRG